MVSRTALVRLISAQRAVASTKSIAPSKRALFTFPAQKYYHSSPPWQLDVSEQASQKRSGNPIAESMKALASPTGNNTTAPEEGDEHRNATFLGEGDSDDGFEADVEANPEAHRHKFDDVSASGMHGQSVKLKASYDVRREPQMSTDTFLPPQAKATTFPTTPVAHESLDGTNSAYLGEAASNDAHEADREAYLERYRHQISDSSNAAYLGEADSDGFHETDREANPEVYRHRIEDAGVSGLHVGPGEGVENIPRGGGKRFV